MFPGEFQQGIHRVDPREDRFGQECPGVEPEGSDDLIVPAAPGVDLLTRLSAEGHKTVFQSSMAVLVALFDSILPGSIFIQYRPDPPGKRRELAVRQKADGCKHACVGKTGGAVRRKKLHVKKIIPADGKTFDQGIKRVVLLP